MSTINYVCRCEKCLRVYRKQEKFCTYCGTKLEYYFLSTLQSMMGEVKMYRDFFPALKSATVVQCVFGTPMPKEPERIRDTVKQEKLDEQYNDLLARWFGKVGIPFYVYFRNLKLNNAAEWDDAVRRCREQGEREYQERQELKERMRQRFNDSSINSGYYDEEENERRDRMIAEECEKERRRRRDEYLRSIGRL